MSLSTLAIVLAAGEGSRMKSATPKVLHQIAGRSMLAHVLDSVTKAGIRQTAVVIGPASAQVGAAAKACLPGCTVAEQSERLGTAHAVLAARSEMVSGADVIVLYGDTPLIRPESIRRLATMLDETTAVAVFGFHAANPSGYGRIVVDDDTVERIVEDRDASQAEKALDLCNGGLMALRGDVALSLLEAIGNNNSKKEYYLTDAVAIARQRGLKAKVALIDESEIQGVNDRVQLADAEAICQQRLRHEIMRNGVTLIAPETVFFSADTRIASDVVIEPHCWFGPGVDIASNVTIHAFSHVEGARIQPGASIGPFARLRPGTSLGGDVKVGNFVEIKAASVEEGAKISHLSYIGDARVGAGANIGAGTITCNYDGYLKHVTNIGAGVFVGSNSALVAPVSIGDNANIGAGSVITRDVPPDALAISRSRQTEYEGWAKKYREQKKREKSERK